MEHADSGSVGEKIKIVLPFPEFGPSNRLISDGYGVPEGKRLYIDEVSLYVSLGDTHHAPPEKALAYLSTGTLEDEDEEGRMSIYEPLGVLGWIDRSGPPWAGTTTGFLRSALGTFVDGGLSVFLVTKENIELGKRAGGKPVSHAVVLGRLVDHASEV